MTDPSMRPVAAAPAPSPRDLIHTSIWHETPEADNPYATRSARCRGYDVHGEMAGQARWIEMLWLLMRPELPAAPALDALEALAVALANPGPRDPSVHAAMCAGVGGSPAASALIAALAVGAGRNGGAREVHDAMTMWRRCGPDLAAWRNDLAASAGEQVEIFPERAHVPGFDPHGVSTPLSVRQLCAALAAAMQSAMPTPAGAGTDAGNSTGSSTGPGTRVGIGTDAGIGRGAHNIGWLHAHLDDAASVVGLPLAISGVAACLLHDLGFSPDEGEMLYLLLRLPGAAAHALEQQSVGFKHFPFYRLELDPAATPEETA